MIEYLNLKDINAPYEEEIKAAMNNVVDSGWYLFGNSVSKFEQEWADYCGAQYSVACANGLDAIRLSLQALIELGRIKKDAEVIVPANTYIATILAVSQCGLKPVLVDPDAETYLLAADKTKEAITNNTGVILPVHLYGQVCEMDSFYKLLEDYPNIYLVEDCAQCHGARKMHKRSSAQCYSFYPGKNLGALGDAGAIVSNDTELCETIRMIANYGCAKKYVHDFKGINSRMDEVQAAILSVKLKDLDRCNVRRKEIAERYSREITNPQIILPKVTTKSVYHIYPIRCEKRSELQQYLLDNGIATQIHYPIPPHKQKAYSELNGMSFPISEIIAQTELSIPCNQAMTDEEMTKVITTLNRFEQNNKTTKQH